MTRYFAELAWLGGERAERDVLIEVQGERIARVVAGAERPGDAIFLAGLTLPGLANAHSHAFHRALRGRTHRGGGTFWTWREDMYAVAERLDPDSYFALARAVYGEMALAGITCVGEFHYLHHGPDGAPYDDANAMGEALIEAAREAGIRITLLDACYLAGGFDQPPSAPQQRFSDGTADAWAERVAALKPRDHARIGAAIHSVRAVPAEALATVAQHAPLHFHLSEQRAENEACQAAHGCTPSELLAEHGALGTHACAVHATHLTRNDIRLLHDTTVCMCPTTERDLADGIGPAPRPLCLGSDSHAVIDPFEEARALELDERLRTETRGHHPAAELLRAAANHAPLGWDDAGAIREGARADLVTVALDSVRLAGTHPDTALESVVFAATAADVRTVAIDGRTVVEDGRHTTIDVPRALQEALC